MRDQSDCRGIYIQLYVSDHAGRKGFLIIELLKQLLKCLINKKKTIKLVITALKTQVSESPETSIRYSHVVISTKLLQDYWNIFLIATTATEIKRNTTFIMGLGRSHLKRNLIGILKHILMIS